MNSRSGVPLYALLLLVLLLGRASLPGSLPKSESLPQGESAETTKSGAAGLRALVAKSPDSSDSDSVSDCILIQLGVLDKGERICTARGGIRPTVFYLKAKIFNTC